jgi:predicted nucleic acid-binding protein
MDFATNARFAGSGMSVLLDSVILIDHLNDVPAATTYLASLKNPTISPVTRAETLSGPSIANPSILAEWLDRFQMVPITAETADLAAAFRRSYRWRLPDAFQAALANIHGLKLATRNTRDFPPKRFSFVIVPYSI